MTEAAIHLTPVINVDKDKCRNCHRCIAICPVKLCNDGSKDYVSVNSDLCIGCGACITACTHGARSGIDDTEAFFEDLKRGEEISILIAPAFQANYPEEYATVLGGLKALGVRRMINVSFGADMHCILYSGNRAPIAQCSQTPLKVWRLLYSHCRQLHL